MRLEHGAETVHQQGVQSEQQSQQDMYGFTTGKFSHNGESQLNSLRKAVVFPSDAGASNPQGRQLGKEGQEQAGTFITQ